jgi:hypothetical protein
MPVANIPQRSRGTAAVVLSRADAPPTGGEPTDAAPHAPGAAWPRWFTILTAVTLGAAVAGLWALLLFGDALRR